MVESNTNAGKPHNQVTAQHSTGHGSEAVVQVQRPEPDGRTPAAPSGSGRGIIVHSQLLPTDRWLLCLCCRHFHAPPISLSPSLGFVSAPETEIGCWQWAVAGSAEPCSPEFHFRHEMNWRSNRPPQIPRSSSSSLSLYAWLGFACFWFNLHTIHFDFFGGVRRPQVTSQVRLPSLLCPSSKQAKVVRCHQSKQAPIFPSFLFLY